MNTPTQARTQGPRGWQRRRWRAAADDRGSESVELAILLPVAILILAMLVVGARIALASDRISGVAGIAARDASLARSPANAQSIAVSSATDALGGDDLHCSNIRVTVDTAGFAGLDVFHRVAGDGSGGRVGAVGGIRDEDFLARVAALLEQGAN